MRQESVFFSSAFSFNEAMGLFQFMPGTFNRLDKEWGLLKTAKVKNRESYLLDEKLSVELDARWVQKLLNMKVNDNNPLWALMNHNAPGRKIKEWKNILTAEGKLNDVEYAIETINYAQTRSFIKKVIANMIIVDAIEIYKPSRKKEALKK